MTSTVKVPESKTAKAMLEEIQRETAITKRILERVPEDKLSWKPHPKSLSLGQLANHIAMIPGSMSGLARVEVFDVANAQFDQATPASLQEILATFDAGVKIAEERVGGFSDSALDVRWRMTAGGKEIMNVPRLELLRTILLNHWYHHRGQLSVYLRMLDVPIPSIYGPSADENPFM
jgi:uncharacterized damage-inducible protein DinB